MEPSSGAILWQGQEVNPSELLKTVSYLFQFPERQIFSRTVYDEIAFGLRQQNLNRDEVEERVQFAMQTVGLQYEDFAERAPHLLSGGEMRKVALASSIVLDRPLMIYDEPTAELDSDAVALLKAALRETKKRGDTQIIASHDVDFLFEMCDDFVMLRSGSVRFAGDKDGLYGQSGLFKECGLSVPMIVSVCEDRGLSDYARENRIVSVSQLVRKLQQTT
jgi:energy-coupling factor transporter ATP-binding protein EcfA2